MTPYDAWRTNVQDTNEEEWNDAVGEVAYEIAGRTSDMEEWVGTVAGADDVLTWLSHAVEVPQHHVHAFRDLTKLSARLRNDVEKEMKNYRDARD